MVALLLVVLTCYLCVVTWKHSYDDAYITYTYAKAFAQGRGLTWHGDPVLGTTSPLLAVLLGGLQMGIPLGVPVWGHLVCWVAQLVAAWMLFELLGRELNRWAGLVAAHLWLTAPIVLDLLGGEMPTGVAMVLTAAWALSTRRWAWAGVAFAAAVALRPELGLAALILSISTLRHYGRKEGIRMLLRSASVALGLWGGWLLILWRLAGTVVPHTLAAKLAQAASVLGVWNSGLGFWQQAYEQFTRHFYPEVEVLLLIASVGAVSVFLWRAVRRPFLAGLVMWGVLHMAMLASIGIPYYPWYVTPGHLSVVLVFASMVEPPRVPRAMARRVWVGVALALIVLTLGRGAAGRVAAHARGSLDARACSNSGVARWINAHYPAATTALAIEIGYLGFVGNFRTLDVLGLVTPEVPLESVRSGELHQIVAELDPDLVVVSTFASFSTERIMNDPREFSSKFRLDQIYDQCARTMLVYRRSADPPRGEVVRDLMPEWALAKPTRFRRRGRHTVPTLLLRPGQTLSAQYEGVSVSQFFTAVGAERDSVELSLYASNGKESVEQTVSTQADQNWRAGFLILPSGPGWLSLQCEASSQGACLLALPSIELSHPRRADRR